MKILALFFVSIISSTALATSSIKLPPSRAQWNTHQLALRGGDVESSAGKEELLPKNTVGPNSAPPGFIRSAFPNFPWHRLPNFLTYLRCLSIPVLMVLFYQPDMHLATSVLFAGASITDWLDGYLARRWDIASPFGAFLDPVADKLAVSTALILLAGRYGKDIAIPCSIILGREVAVTALREWMATQGARSVVKVGFQGKLKTAATMVAITLLLAIKDSTEKAYLPGLAFLYLCAVVTVTSGSVYFQAAAPILFGK
mmetsp:Transcript_22060/g.32593  ORF Transcript_22060/g.32593 Transcript_22060/m.32593 type:complete len:257 (+) Transcript_22060:130-900(+)|eukprot:CAMPEP_0194210854 /NCGR_PEP_ID=MMETSP0156-20130528/9148_1 /TAXON_ID=33649 /ORGANISM="Thalassionema nitzschioides, Strain L26-B" /LENGTH=256 /DNA_ID=CAMNT_0038938263 /DNA_START=83 /DNA_END=853 /DNA_ORIENTATION=+